MRIRIAADLISELVAKMLVVGSWCADVQIVVLHVVHERTVLHSVRRTASALGAFELAHGVHEAVHLVVIVVAPIGVVTARLRRKVPGSRTLPINVFRAHARNRLD
jgi:hypothetical protein